MAVDLDALIRAVRSNPEARDTLRRELLTEDLLALPGQVERLAARTDARFAEVAERLEQLAGRVEQLAAAQVRTEERLEQLAAAQTRTEERLAEVQTIAKRANGRVSNLVGAEYERQEAVRAVWSIEAAVGVAPGALRPITIDELRPQLAAAVAAKALTPQAADAITKVNGLFAWGPAPGQVSGYVVVEASLTADHTDVERAVARAADLERVTGVATRAVVVSDQVATDAAESIRRRRVAHVRVPPRRHQIPSL
ncbi:MAG: hypothetical protein M0027_12660 [Candidatus Dormibacteraeota bacterium]|jgi:hypothetical protein|nr:hypothetical protein [Candidatus Dormibacteraeota bacterium]